MPTRIVVDEAVAEARRPAIVDVLSESLNGRDDADSLIAVVTQLPSGRLTVFVNHVADPAFTATLEAALAKLR